MAGFRTHLTYGIITGSFIAATAQYLSLNLPHYNPGVTELIKLILSAGAGGTIADIDQRFSFPSSILLALIYTALSATYVKFYFTTLYSPNMEIGGLILVITTSFLMIFALTKTIFQLFQSIFIHGNILHSMLYVTLLLLFFVAILFVQNHLNPETARYGLIGHIISFLTAYLVHLGVDKWR